MPNLLLKTNGELVQKTTIAYAVDEGKSHTLKMLSAEETTMSLMGNFFASEGRPGKVLEIKCKKRTGKENFVTCMQKTLESHFDQEKSVALGGAFLVKEGSVKIHVMSNDFCPLHTDEELNTWLNFYEMKSPMIFLSEFVSSDPVRIGAQKNKFYFNYLCF